MILKWLISGTVRDAVALHKHVTKLLDAQRDILPGANVRELDAAIGQLKTAVAQATPKPALLAEMKSLEDAANKYLKPYPNAAWRENLEVLLVAIGVAMAIRTFFLQPFKIPTGSMQPTLFGVTPEPHHFGIMPDPRSGNQANLKIPNWFQQRFDYWFHGWSYFNVTAPEDGVLQQVRPPMKLLLFNLKQEYVFNGRTETVWFPADELFERAGYLLDANGVPHTQRFAETGEPIAQEIPPFAKGQSIVRLRIQAGDHLFVNRISYNFVHPDRGDIVVFKTRGIARIRDQDTYYIKRLVGLSGETLGLEPRHQLRRPVAGLNSKFEDTTLGTLVVNGKTLSTNTPGFEEVYSFNGTGGAEICNYVPNLYYGHAAKWELEKLGSTVTVATNHYFVCGDNTLNSWDSRGWGDFPRENVIGKSSFVYWPISSRFGFGYR